MFIRFWIQIQSFSANIDNQFKRIRDYIIPIDTQHSIVLYCMVLEAYCIVGELLRSADISKVETNK